MIQGEQYWKDRRKEDEHRDWDYDERTWVQDYIESRSHPHREQTLEILKTFPWDSLLEVGCSAGPNLFRIREEFPDKSLTGIDVNFPSVIGAWDSLPSGIDIEYQSLHEMNFKKNSFDVVLADAVLMYSTPEEIKADMDRLAKVARKAIIIIDRYSHEEDNNGYVWSRDYGELLKLRGFAVKEWPVTPELWPTSKSWQANGKYWLGIK